MNYIPQYADVIFIGLNPTPKALQDGALFSNDRSLWNILERAGFYAGTAAIPAVQMYPLLVSGQLNTHVKIGIADVLPHVVAQHATCVRVEPDHVIALVNQVAAKKVKRMGLMGDKVARAFAKVYPQLTYHSIQNKQNNMGKLVIGNHTITIYSLPFPNNNSIPGKEGYYRNLITNN